MCRVLVCGGRDYHNRDRLFAELDHIDAERGISLIISGCAGGADSLAIDWTRKWDLLVSLFPADWKQYGNAAGPIRNQKMIDYGKPDLVVAFPGGKGTADMVAKAKRAGIEVIAVAG